MKNRITALLVAVLIALSVPAFAMAEQPAEPEYPEPPQEQPVAEPGDPVEDPEPEAPAEDMESSGYGIWVAGKQLTADLLTVDSSVDERIKGGSAVYSPETNTLTLSDFVFEGPAPEIGEIEGFAFMSVILSADPESDFTIVLSGENSVAVTETANDGDEITSDIFVSGNLTLTGDGTLALSDGMSSSTVDSCLTVLGKSEFSAKTVTAYTSALTAAGGVLSGFCLGDGAVFTSGEYVVAVASPEGSGEGECDGIICFNGSLDFNGAEVNVSVSGTTAGVNSFGIFASDDISIAAGCVESYCAFDTPTSGAFSSCPGIVSGFDAVLFAGNDAETAVGYEASEIGQHYAERYVKVCEKAEVVTHAVVFNTNGGKINGEVPDSYAEGIGLVLPSDVTKDGCDFAGWYEDEAFTGQPVTEIGPDETTDKAFYAKWVDREKATHKITFNTNGGKILEDVPEYYTEGTPLTLPVYVVKDGNTFAGWYETEDFSGKPVVAISANETTDKVFYAKWTAKAPVTHKITFNTDGGKIEGEVPTSYPEGTEVKLPEKVTKEGFSFGGWYETQDFSGKPVTRISAEDKTDKLFYAKWIAETGTISEVVISCDYSKLPYFYIGEEIPPIQSCGPDAYDGPLVLSDENCYVAQAGWMYLDEDGEWQPTFMNKAAFEQGVKYAYSAVIFPKQGYEFAEGENILRTENGSDLSLFNVCIKAEQMHFCYDLGMLTEYKISFDTDGGSSVESQSIALGGKVTKPSDPEKEGYEFDGWYADPDFSEKYDFDADYVVGDRTIYAKWNKSASEPIEIEKTEKESFPTAAIVIIIAAVAAAVIIIVVCVNRSRKKRAG